MSRRYEDLIRDLAHEIEVGRRERRVIERRAEARERETDELRLRQVGPVGGDLAAAPAGGRPDLGSPLMTRLRADAGFDDANSASVHSTNMLKDPLLESTLLSGNVVVGTGWTSIGTHWEARKRAVSGDSPVVTARHTHQRKLMEGHIYRSDIVAFDIAYAGVGESYVDMRPTEPAPAPVHIDWPWCVAQARVYIDKLIRPWTNLDSSEADEADEINNYARLVIVDGATADTIEDPTGEGDSADLEEMDSDQDEAHLYVAAEVGGTQWMTLVIHTLSAGAGGICVAVAEPSINYSYQEAPMPYEAPAQMASDGDVADAIETHDDDPLAHGGATGVSEHSDLTGLDDDDHTKYALMVSQTVEPAPPARPEMFWYDPAGDPVGTGPAGPVGPRGPMGPPGDDLLLFAHRADQVAHPPGVRVYLYEQFS